MDTSLFLARVLGLYLIIVSGVLLFNKAYVRKAIGSVLQNEGIQLVLGIITLILGILLVLFHNLWVENWRVVITLLAWLVFLQGILRLYRPDVVRGWMQAMRKDRVYHIVASIAGLLGLYLGYMGFLS